LHPLRHPRSVGPQFLKYDARFDRAVGMPLNVSRTILATDVHCAAKSLRQLAKETGDHLCPKLVSRLAGLKLETHHPVIEPVSTRAGNGNF